MLFPDAKPNAAHQKLAELERAGKLSCVITQNIDGLHLAAGSKNVLELHGSVHRNFCENCKKLFGLAVIRESEGVPRCSCGGVVKPDVVLYEEGLDDQTLRRSVEEIKNADFSCGGTSLNVYPAAGLIDYFPGGNLVLINKAPTPMDGKASLILPEKNRRGIEKASRLTHGRRALWLIFCFRSPFLV